MKFSMSAASFLELSFLKINNNNIPFVQILLTDYKRHVFKNSNPKVSRLVLLECFLDSFFFSLEDLDF